MGSDDHLDAGASEDPDRADAVPAGAVDCRFHERAVHLTGCDTLVLADLHVGRESTAGIEVPLDERGRLLDRLTAVLAASEPARVVFAGDLLHRFDRLDAASRRTIEALYDACLDVGSDPVALAGNHDARLADCWPDPVERERKLPDGTVVCHGHEEPAATGERYLVGHDHPAIAIEGVRRPCFLFGEGVYRGGDLLVLPAFTPLAGGVEVNDRRGADFRSPLVSSLGTLRPVVVDDDRGLWFPPLGSFRELL